MRAKLMACPFQFGTQLRKVVDLPVDNQRYIAIASGKRLMAATQIDDRQPAHAEPDDAVTKCAVVVGATMGHGVAHRSEQGPGHGVAIETELAVDAAHII